MAPRNQIQPTFPYQAYPQFVDWLCKNRSNSAAETGGTINHAILIFSAMTLEGGLEWLLRDKFRDDAKIGWAAVDPNDKKLFELDKSIRGASGFKPYAKLFRTVFNVDWCDILPRGTLEAVETLMKLRNEVVAHDKSLNVIQEFIDNKPYNLKWETDNLQRIQNYYTEMGFPATNGMGSDDVGFWITDDFVDHLYEQTIIFLAEFDLAGLHTGKTLQYTYEMTIRTRTLIDSIVGDRPNPYERSS